MRVPSGAVLWRVWRAAALTLGILVAAPLSVTAGDKDRDEWQQPKRVLRDLGLVSGSSVADIGCGEGYFTARLSRAVGPEGKVLAVDTSAMSLVSILKLAQRRYLANVETVLSESTSTKLPSKQCDVALICNVLHHVPEKQRLALIKDVARALKRRGSLFIIDWGKKGEVKSEPSEEGIRRRDLIKLGTDAGLSLDAEFYYLEYQVFLRFRKPDRAEPK